MAPDALPELIDALLRLPLLEPAQLRELFQHLPDPQAAAQEMGRRGWITPDQLASLVPDLQQRPTPRETVLVGFGDDDVPPDAEGDGFHLIVSDEEEKAEVPPEVETARPDRIAAAMPSEPETVGTVPVFTLPESASPFEWAALIPSPGGGNEPCRRASDPDKLLWQYMGWASKGLLLWLLFLGGFFAGLKLLGTNSTAPPVARQESRGTKKKPQVLARKRGAARPQIAVARTDKQPKNQAAGDDRAGAADGPRVPAPANDARRRDDLNMAENAEPAARGGPAVAPQLVPQGRAMPVGPQVDPFQQRVRQQVMNMQSWNRHQHSQQTRQRNGPRHARYRTPPSRTLGPALVPSPNSAWPVGQQQIVRVQQ